MTDKKTKIEKVKETFVKGKDKVKETAHKVDDKIHESPYKAMGIAVVVSAATAFVVGLFFRRKKKE